MRTRNALICAGLVACLAACEDGEPGMTAGPGTVTATQSGTALEALKGVALACDGADDGSVRCAWSDAAAGQELELWIVFTSDYAAAAAGTMLALGPDFTLTKLTYSLDGGYAGFSGSGASVAIGELTIILGARDGSTAATFDGTLEKAPEAPGPGFTVSFDEVAGTFP